MVDAATGVCLLATRPVVRDDEGSAVCQIGQ